MVFYEELVLLATVFYLRSCLGYDRFLNEAVADIPFVGNNPADSLPGPWEMCKGRHIYVVKLLCDLIWSFAGKVTPVDLTNDPCLFPVDYKVAIIVSIITE